MRDPRPAPTMATTEPTRSEPAFRTGRPNVVVIVLDDLGFGHLGCYGSNLDTPNLDALAASGVRFTNFHTTAVCSPTRACLLTGRNHHRVGMGMLPDVCTDFPGYTGEIPSSAGTMAHILRDQGYATYCVGKWHLTPRDQRDTGPFHTWPSGLGFDHYYGFLNGETNQWTPHLIRDHQHVDPPRSPYDGYHLDEDLADNAISYVRGLRQSNPERPFFLYYATAAPHAPHHVHQEWVTPYEGRFDDGWDAYREQTFARQQELGIVPPDARLSERPNWIEAWDDVDDDRRRLYARMMEVFGGFVTHADHHIGRVLDHLRATGELENTIVCLVSDNGASAEGGPHGTYNQMGHYVSDDEDDIDDELAHIDDIGGFRSSNHYAWGWAWAGNTPFRRWKRYTFEGGVRDPFIIAGPGVGDAGSTRAQYAHVVDVLPTVLDLLDIDVPTELDGRQQMSVDGASFRTVLDDEAAADTRTSQYYECWGSRAIYEDGWKAVTNHTNQLTLNERTHVEGSADFATDEWMLFDTRTDFSETTDLAEAEPERLRALVDAWFEAAEANQVFPLDDGVENRFAHMRNKWVSWRSEFTLAPGEKMHEVVGPILAGGFRIAAAFDGDVAGDFVIVEQGDWISGWCVFVRDGLLRWSMAGKGRTYDASMPVPAGAAVLTCAGEIVDGLLVITLGADGADAEPTPLGVKIPLVWSTDGVFLRCGYGKEFPVHEDEPIHEPAPSSFRGVHITTGPPPPVDPQAEFERIMRHQ